MIPLLGNQHVTRLEPVRIFLATVSGTGPKSKPGRSFLGLWIKQLGKWICSFPLDRKPQGMKGLELLLPSWCQVEQDVVGLRVPCSQTQKREMEKHGTLGSRA